MLINISRKITSALSKMSDYNTKCVYEHELYSNADLVVITDSTAVIPEHVKKLNIPVHCLGKNYTGTNYWLQVMSQISFGNFQAVSYGKHGRYSYQLFLFKDLDKITSILKKAKITAQILDI